MPNYMTDSVTLGRTMINVVLRGYVNQIVESRDIYILGK